MNKSKRSMGILPVPSVVGHGQDARAAFLRNLPLHLSSLVLLVAYLGTTFGQLHAASTPAASPGLILRIQSLASPKSPADVRVVRLAGLYVPQNTPPSAFIAPGPFRATFE